MEYDAFVAHLRQALGSTGLPEAEEFEYTAHSTRSGATTEAVHAGLPPLLICEVAGVKSIDWLVGYMYVTCGRTWATGSAPRGPSACELLAFWW